MKKQALLLILSVALFFGTASANHPSDIPSVVLSAFNQEYVNASAISWVEGVNWFKASFKVEDVYLTAYYNTLGETIGVSRNITTRQLPLLLQRDIKENYADFWVTDLFELALNDDTTYYITLENADEIITLEGHEGYWSNYKKTKKG